MNGGQKEPANVDTTKKKGERYVHRSFLHLQLLSRYQSYLTISKETKVLTDGKSRYVYRRVVLTFCQALGKPVLF